MARLHPAGHQIVTGALGGGLHQHGGLDLAEMVVAQEVAGDLADLAAQHQRLVHGRAAQVQIAVLQAQLVLHLHLVPNLKGRGLGGAEHPQLADIQLHIAGGDLVGLGVPLPQGALGDDHILALQAAGLFKHGPVGAVVEHQLQNAAGVPQVHEDDAALVAALGHRTGHHHLLPGIRQTHFAAVSGAAQVAHGLHFWFLFSAPDAKRPANSLFTSVHYTCFFRRIQGKGAKKATPAEGAALFSNFTGRDTRG